MRVVQMAAKADQDGNIHLTIPLGTANEEFELAIVVSPKPNLNGATKLKTLEEPAWPPAFLEKTFGSIDDESFCRPPQLPFDPVEPLE